MAKTMDAAEINRTTSERASAQALLDNTLISWRHATSQVSSTKTMLTMAERKHATLAEVAKAAAKAHAALADVDLTNVTAKLPSLGYGGRGASFVSSLPGETVLVIVESLAKSAEKQRAAEHDNITSLRTQLAQAEESLAAISARVEELKAQAA